jgi:MFS family permease
MSIMRLPRASAQHNSGRFHGWRVVAGAFTLAVFAWGLGFYGPPIYLQAVHEARGWSLALVSTAISAHYLLGAVVVANLPRLYRHFGIATVAKFGSLSLALGVLGWALAAQPWQLFAATVFSGAGWAATGPATVNAVIAPWFVRTRPAALSSAYNGASVGGIIFSPLWVVSIGLLGFPMAAALIGLTTIVTIWILAEMLFRKTPEEMGVFPDGLDPVPAADTMPSSRELAGSKLWGDFRFLTLALGMALGLFAQIGLLSQLFSLLVPPLGAQLAGIALGAATAAAISGRTLVGWLMPANADRRRIASCSYAVQIAGLMAFLLASGDNVYLLLAGVVLFGLGIGNATSLPPLIAQSEFAKSDVSRVVPLILAVSQAAYAFAPAAFGFIREFSPHGTANGAEPVLFSVAALIQAAAIAMFLMGRRRPKR